MTTSTDISLNQSTGRSTTFFKRVLTRIWKPIKQAKLRRSQRQEYLRDYKELAQLPDYLLKDVGISRSQLNFKLNKPYWWS